VKEIRIEMCSSANISHGWFGFIVSRQLDRAILLAFQGNHIRVYGKEVGFSGKCGV
jgi:hypothetical protein